MSTFSNFLDRIRSIFAAKIVSIDELSNNLPDEPETAVDDPKYDIEHVTPDDDTPRDPLPEPEQEIVEDLVRTMVPETPWLQRQQWLVDLGYDPGPVDGKPGPRTEQAVRAFQKDKELTVDGSWGPKTEKAARDALLAKKALVPPSIVVTPEIMGPTMYDDMLGDLVLDEDFWDCFIDLTKKSNVLDEQGRRRRKGTRKWSNIVRIVWHQTSFTWRPYLVLTKLKKYSSHHKVNSHALFDTDGSIILLHNFAYYLWTANMFNPDCLSFEIMGNFEGVLGSGQWYLPNKFGRARPQRIQLIRARQFTFWLMNPEMGPADKDLPVPLLEWRQAVRKHGNPLKWVNAHRQATNDRGGDCGSECWYHVVLWTVFRCDKPLTVGPEKGKGQTIPVEWKSKPAIPPLA